MTIVRVNSADIDHAKLLEEIRNIPPATEEQIEAWAAEDGDAWTEEDFARARHVYPPPKPERIQALRAALGLSQKQFADRFGFTVDAIQQYEQGRRTPSGPAATLLWVIACEPEAVARAIERRNATFRPADDERSAAE